MEEAFFQSLMELCREKKFDVARQKYNEFADEKRNVGKLSARIISWLAKIEGLSGNFSREIEILENLLIDFPDYYSANFSIARSNLKLKNYKEVIKYGQEVLTYEELQGDKKFSGAAAYLVAYAAMKLSDKLAFTHSIHLVEDNHTEWVQGRLWSKRNLIDEMNGTFRQK